MTLKIEAGKYYRNKLGDTRGPMIPNPDHHSMYKWKCPNSNDTYCDGGEWYSTVASSDKDLRYECDQHGNPMSAQAAPRNGNLLDKGKYYRAYDGTIYGPMGMITSGGLLSFFCTRTNLIFKPDGMIHGAAHGDGRNIYYECDAKGAPIQTAAPPAQVSPPTFVLGVGKCYLDGTGNKFGPMRSYSAPPVHVYICNVTGTVFEPDGKYMGASQGDPRNLAAECDAQGNPLVISHGIPAGVYVIRNSAGTWTPSSPPVTMSAPARTPDIVDQALAAQKKAEQTELERQQALPTPEQRLEEYRRNVARLAERGNLY